MKGKWWGINESEVGGPVGRRDLCASPTDRAQEVVMDGILSEGWNSPQNLIGEPRNKKSRGN